MKRATSIIKFLITLILCCPLGCSPFGQDADPQVRGSSSSELISRTLLPARDTAISYLDIHGDGPDSAAFSRPGVTGSSLVQNGLAAGSWMITVDAFNAGHELIGTGSISTMIEAGGMASVPVELGPVAGTGDLSILVSWPLGSVANPAVSGALTFAGGVSEGLSFTTGTTSASSSMSSLQSGYYSLTLQLSDGGVLEWGSFEAVRIMDGLTTTAQFDLTPADLLSGD